MLQTLETSTYCSNEQLRLGHTGNQHGERPRQDCRTRSRAPLRAALLRVRSSSHWAAGTLAFASVAVPRPCDAPGHGPTDWLRQGVRFWCWPRRRRHSQGAPLPARVLPYRVCKDGAQRTWRFAVNPERPNGVRGQNRNLSLISVADRNQHRHSMTPGRLAAVKDRGCPPILSPLRLRLGSKNRLPPRPLPAAAAHSRRRP